MTLPWLQALGSGVLAAAPLVALLARPRLRPDDITQAQKRSQILAAVATEPGISVGRLRHKTGMTWGTLTYHLDILEAAGSVKISREERTRFVFPPADDHNSPSTADRVLAAGNARLIARDIAHHPDTAIADIALRTGVSPRMTYYHVGALAEAGLLRTEGRRRFEKVSGTPRLSALLTDYPE